MNKKREKTVIGYIVIGIAMYAVIITASLNIVNASDRQDIGRWSKQVFTDPNENVYIAAFLRDITEDSITVDVVEFITSGDTARMKSLYLTEEDMPDGYYIYNPEQETVTWELTARTVYTFIDWNGDFTGSDCPEKYTTTDIREFMKYIDTYGNAAHGMPFFFQVEDGSVMAVVEKFFA